MIMHPSSMTAIDTLLCCLESSDLDGLSNADLVAGEESIVHLLSTASAVKLHQLTSLSVKHGPTIPTSSTSSRHMGRVVCCLAFLRYSNASPSTRLEIQLLGIDTFHRPIHTLQTPCLFYISLIPAVRRGLPVFARDESRSDAERGGE